jgi:hypothetical protein
MSTKVPTRIVITESEETYYCIKVVTGDKVVNSTIEMSAVDKILTDKVWTREQYMFDVPDLKDRIYFTGILQEMMGIIDQYEGEVVQIVYEADPDNFSTIRSLGHIPIMSEPSKMTYFIKEVEPISIIKDESPPYENISNDVEHVEKFFKFHTEKVMAGQLKHCDDFLVNLDDVAIFIGYSEKSQMVREFKKSNFISNLEYFILNDEDQIKDIPKMECFTSDDYQTTKAILVINEMVLDQFLQIKGIDWSQIGLVVCDTNMERESTLLLSHCKRHEIVHVRKIQYGNWYNFGVYNEYQKCHPYDDFSHDAVISFNDDVLVERPIFVVFVDPRYAYIYRIASAMELCKDVWTISVIHDIFDDLVKNYYDYKFMPIFQSDQIIKICNVMKRGIFHTPLAFFTKFPAIAKMLFEASVFVSCDKEHFKTYIKNVHGVFDKKIKHQFNQHLDLINTAKSIASDRKKKIDLVKEAVVKHEKKRVLHDIVYGKQEKLLENALQQLKIK